MSKKQPKKLIYHTFQKIKRTFTAFLPVSKERRGECARCGVCCTMGWTCPFLDYVIEDGKRLAICKIRKFRPLNCRKYPRVKKEQLILPCGYSFEDGIEKKEKKT